MRRRGAPSAMSPALAAALGVVSLAHAARGQTEPVASPKADRTAVQLEYSAPGNCPQATEFEARVLARTDLAQFDDSARANTVVRVRIRATGAAYTGHLSMVSHQGTMSSRDVDDAICGDVVDALALVTALAIDPGAGLEPKPRAPSPPPPAPPLPPAPTPPQPAAQPPSPAQASRAPAPPPPRSAPIPAPALAPAEWHASVGVDATVLSGVAPDALLGGGLFGEVDAASGGWLAPSLRISVLASGDHVFESPPARFALVEGRVDACPLRLGSRSLWVRPCASVEAGVLAAHGTAVATPLSASPAWAATGPIARVRWSPARRRFFAEIEGAAIFPLTRPDFVFVAPATTVHQVPRVVPSVSVGGGVHFP